MNLIEKTGERLIMDFDPFSYCRHAAEYQERYESFESIDNHDKLRLILWCGNCGAIEVTEVINGESIENGWDLPLYQTASKLEPTK